MDGYEFQGALPPFYSSSHDYEMSWNRYQDYGGMEQQQHFSNYANSSQDHFYEGSSQAFTSQHQWCSFCGGDHFEENCYTLYPTNHVPHQHIQGFCANMSRATYQGNTPPSSQPLWCTLCGGPHETENCFTFDPNYQYGGRSQEPFYQEPQQEYPSFNQDPEMKSLMANLLVEMNELQFQLHNMMAQRQGLATQEPNQELFSNGEVQQELFLPNESFVVEENKKQGEDIDDEDEDDEAYNECVEKETPSWGERVELQGNGGDEQLEDNPIEDVFKNGEMEEDCGTNNECSSLDDTLFDENFRTIWEPGGVNVLESVGHHWPIFISNDSHLLLVHEKDQRFPLIVQEKEMRVDEDSIFLEVDCCNFFEENMLLVSLKEFLNARHLRKYFEEKVDGENGLIFVQTCMDCSLRG